MQLQEVSRVHSTRSKARKERIQPIKKLHPQYVAGFVDGEGSFWVSIYKDDCMKNKVLVRPEFSIELRDDDRKILYRIKETIGCGKIYECKYERYGWYPHVKFKVSRFDEISEILIPFFEKWPLQAKQAKRFCLFKKIVEKRKKGQHLTKKGVNEIKKLQEKMRVLGKKHRLETARVRENRLPSGVGQ
ncbi:MAG: LAGLIDADG family homing endonuclease [Candidatus Pacebacteria bacterium]|nr:LAGLIDADG family homing endonuclease [Candidatus Paceibacterota bacterium]